MALSFQSQLQQHTATTISDLDLKAQKAAHSKSLIFDEKIAATQDFDTLFQLCLEGFEDLCSIEPGFTQYRHSLFSDDSRTTDRSQMTVEQNDTLNTALESFIGSVGARLLLSPAVKALEWLVRRFQIHEHNTAFLLFTFLPYYDKPVFRSLLSILSTIPPQFHWLAPYRKFLTNPPQHAIVQAAINKNAFFEAFNQYAVQLCIARHHHEGLLAIWASVTSEAITARLASSQPGKGPRNRQHEELFLTLIPILEKLMALSDVPEAVIACYTFIIIMAQAGAVFENAREPFLITVTNTLQGNCLNPGLICLSSLLSPSRKSHISLPSKVVRGLVRIEGLVDRLRVLGEQYDMASLAGTTAINILQSKKQTRDVRSIELVEGILSADILVPNQVSRIFDALFKALRKTQHTDTSSEQALPITQLVKTLYQRKELRNGLQAAAEKAKFDLATLDLMPAVEEPELDGTAQGTEMVDKTPASHDILQQLLSEVPQDCELDSGLLDPTARTLQAPLVEAFEHARRSEAGIESFSRLPLWKDITDSTNSLLPSFLLAVVSGNYNLQMRVVAGFSLQRWLRQFSNLDTQAMLSYVIFLLAEPTPAVREVGANILRAMAATFPSRFRDGVEHDRWLPQGLCSEEESRRISRASTKQIQKILSRVFVPAIEDCILDPDQMGRVLQITLKPRSRSASVKSEQTEPLKKYLRESLFTLLLEQLSVIPIGPVQIRILGFIKNIESVAEVVKSRKLKGLLHQWAALEHGEIGRLQLPGHLNAAIGDTAFTSIISLLEDDAPDELIQLAELGRRKRPHFASALLERVQELWPALKLTAQLRLADALLALRTDDAQAKPNFFGENALRSLDLTVDVTDHLLAAILDSLRATIDPRPAKKQKKATNSSQATLSQAASIQLRQLIIITESVIQSTALGRSRLVPRLFQVLVALQQIAIHRQSDLGFVMSLTMDGLGSIVKGEPPEQLKLTWAQFNLDAVIDCIQKSDHHSVHQSALQLLASLATIIPERVLASIMPIFAFMSTKMHQDDQYSNDLITQTMDRVLFSLLDAESPDVDPDEMKRNVLLGFVTAFGHIPSQKRKQIFGKLLVHLKDTRWFLALTQELMGRENDPAVIQGFLNTVFHCYSHEDQLKIAKDVSSWIRLRRLPTSPSEVYMHVDSFVLRIGHAPSQQQGNELSTNNEATLLVCLNSFVGNNLSLHQQPGEYYPYENPDALASLFHGLLVEIIELVESRQGHDDLKAAETVLKRLMTCLPTGALIPMVEFTVRPGVPESVRVQIAVLQWANREMKSPQRPLLPVIDVPHTLSQGLLTISQLPRETDEELKQAVVVWTDLLCSLYGRVDPTSVIPAARLLASNYYLSPENNLTATRALLTLSRLTDVLREGIIAIMPSMTKGLIEVLPLDREPDEDLFRASMALLSALARHVVFALSQANLVYTLQLCAAGSQWFSGSDTRQMIRQTTLLIAVNCPLKDLLPIIYESWSSFVASGIDAVGGAIDMLENSIKTTTNVGVVKAADSLFPLFLTIFDFRRSQSALPNHGNYSQAQMSAVEDNIYGITIEVIMKMSSETFGPHFTALLDWSAKSQDVEPERRGKAQVLRQITLFRFLTLFFGRLGALVTNYALKIVDTVAILKAARELPRYLSDPDQQRLYTSLLSALATAFLHDEHAHFSNPTYFEPISENLVLQLTIVPPARKDSLIRPHILPAIATFAHAVRSTPSHLKALNSWLFTLRRHDSAAVRLAGVKVHLVLAGASFHAGQDESEPVEAGGLSKDQREVLAEDWCTTALGVGQGLVYINEMLEDDDDEVEREVRRLARRVRVVMGEEGDGMFE